jgi:hypothetical protein
LLEHSKLVIKEKPLAISMDDLGKYSRTISVNPNLFTITQWSFNPVFKNAFLKQHFDHHYAISKTIQDIYRNLTM